MGRAALCSTLAAARAGSACWQQRREHGSRASMRRRVPSGRFDVGDLQFLPYEDRSFDAVTGFNSSQYAADPLAAFTEARRVTRPGAPVYVLVWRREERTALVALLRALRPLLLPAPPGAPGPLTLSYVPHRDRVAVRDRAGMTAAH
ncbi:MAG TPA: methyltransferase domain-containing protein [Chloroflexota bacterium]|nr:methyltransferase domain-containing protein [Chloroflexota bacterium]